MIVKPLNTELTFTAANTVYNSRLVRVHAPALSVLTVTNEEETVVATMTIPAGSVLILEKEPLHTITGTTTLNCVPVAYKN